MPEGMNLEVAHKLSERAERTKRRWQEVVEVLEVLALAIAAIATAWSGYQAARGDGHQSVLYAQSSRDPSPPTPPPPSAASSWWPTPRCSPPGSRPEQPATPSCRRSSSAGSAPNTAVPFGNG